MTNEKCRRVLLWTVRYDKSPLVRAAAPNTLVLLEKANEEIIDTLQIARKLKLPVPNNQQPTLAAYYGVNYRAHSAIEDVRALIQIYFKMTTQPEIKAKREAAGF
jgi:DNA polymerase III epsilon subunit-like protein